MDTAAALRDKLAEIDDQMGQLEARPDDQGSISFGKRVGEGTSMAVDRLSQVAVHDKLQVTRADVERARPSSRTAATAAATCAASRSARAVSRRCGRRPWTTAVDGSGPSTRLARVAERTEYQVTYWRDLPSMVVARERRARDQVAAGARFQEAIDEAAMRLGDTGSDDYLAGWRRGDWTAARGSTTEVADRVVAELEAEWPADRLTAYLDSLGAPA